MITSRFRLWSLFPILLLCVTILITVFFLLNNDVVELIDNKPMFFVVFFGVFFFYSIFLLFWGELRTKCIKIEVNEASVTKRGFLGFGTTSTYKINEVEGYRISSLSSRSGTYEYLYLLVNEKKVIKISEFYHSNYLEMKTVIIRKNFKNLGVEQWSFLTETKEIFQ
ncbi:hypothetical protein [Pedobacter sp.]|jgi:hypothetical protein|uniref:hypothetical protein n=1 Tax=Pedobacter sp. TaxID=1411316 RepID=UPI002BFE783B|nr:hypothetical protein [Pedobacter sp.]HWW40775.1 hypothetical protein [Pedobacter sp.]